MSPSRRHAKRPARKGAAADLRLLPQAALAIRRGHPWVWREAIVSGGGGLKSGAIVNLHDRSGAFVGKGIWDASSPIAARVLTRNAGEAVDIHLFGRRFEQAIARRAAFIDMKTTNAYRLCNGEGDSLPGLVIDRYDDIAVMRLDGSLLDIFIEPLTERLQPILEACGIRSLARRKHRDENRKEGKLEPLFGPPPPKSLTVLENGIRMVVDLAYGQKTGAFLDQRENRAKIGELAKGRRVLNLFSYAGGFSTAAALGGALHVTSVDMAHAAHATAQASMRENGLDPRAHSFVTADAFAFLEAARERNERWDLIISDPPSFAPSERAVPRALGAYRKLHEGCASVLADGGIFCAASCSSHITAEAFLTTLDESSLGGRSGLSLVALHGPGADHPTLPAFPEGRYLKFAVLA